MQQKTNIFKDLFSLLPCPLSLQTFKTSCLSFQLHCFWQNSYFHICQPNYIPSCLCFTSKRSIIRPVTLDLFSLLFLLFGLFPDFRLCHSVFRHMCVCVCACVQGACVVGGFGYHKASKQISLSKQTIPEKIRKFNCKFFTFTTIYHIKKFYILYSEVGYVFFTDLIKIVVIFPHSLNWFVLGLLYEEKKSRNRLPVRNFLVLVFLCSKYVSMC